MVHTFWEEAYRIGIDELDDEHMELCALMARFRQALDDHEDRAVIESIFRKLRAKMVSHFNNEEQILQRIDYPEDDFREHVDGHLDVLYTFDHEFSKWEKSPEDEGYPARLSNLCVWALTELLTADMQVKDHLAQSRSPKEPRK